MKTIDPERLAANLNLLVERTENFHVEKLSVVWFELFDFIETCRSLSAEEIIFEVRREKPFFFDLHKEKLFSSFSETRIVYSIDQLNRILFN